MKSVLHSSTRSPVSSVSSVKLQLHYIAQLNYDKSESLLKHMWRVSPFYSLTKDTAELKFLNWCV